ncbi:hypothetical protein AB2L28_04190 [Kineococcus sp. TBRC 1896]|uniref:Uncharacterized protein n=1 Tax=Kineococcus mangrovi TaxID=1660183 RepID=A0ABV4HYT6_9ACTN
MDDYTVWKVYAPAGLLLVGAGVCVVTDAAVRRARRGRWVARGTVGLVALNAGLSVFGEAVKRRALHDVRSPGR